MQIHNVSRCCTTPLVSSFASSFLDISHLSALKSDVYSARVGRTHSTLPSRSTGAYEVLNSQASVVSVPMSATLYLATSTTRCLVTHLSSDRDDLDPSRISQPTLLFMCKAWFYQTLSTSSSLHSFRLTSSRLASASIGLLMKPGQLP